MRWLELVGVLAVVSASGCGTLVNFASGSPEIYGGVQNDGKFMAGLHAASGKGAVCAVAILGAEFPASFVADTLTLPLVAYIQHKQNAADSDRVVATPPHDLTPNPASPPPIKVSLGAPRPLARAQTEETAGYPAPRE